MQFSITPRTSFQHILNSTHRVVLVFREIFFLSLLFYIYIYIYMIKDLRIKFDNNNNNNNNKNAEELESGSDINCSWCTWNDHHPHHHVMPPARIPLTLSCHFSLSFIASGRSSGLQPVSSQSFCMYVRAGCPAFEWPYVGVHRSTSLMSSSLLLQQCPACLVHLTWIVFVMGGR